MAVGENVLERHGRQRTPGGQLHVAVQPVFVAGHHVNGRPGIDHRVLHEDADADGHLVGRQDFLALDGQIAIAHVHQHHFHLGPAPEGKQRHAGQFITAGAEHMDQHAVLVPQTAVRVLDDDVGIGHGSPSSLNHETPNTK